MSQTPLLSSANNDRSEMQEEIIDNLQDLGHLGSGSNAIVKKAIYNGKLVAVKLFYKKRENREAPDYLREINTLRKVNHDNIIKVIKTGKWSDKNDVFECMVIEYADTGSLYHVLYDRKEYEYTLGHAVSWLTQCADAINYLHSFRPKPILHRDLKPLNLLLMNGGVLLKVCDFGTATSLKTIMTVDIGSPCWVAPESMSGDKYDEKCDIYSYSIITWEVLVRLNPYFDIPNANSGAIMFMVTSRNMRPQKIANCPRLFQLFFNSCWSADPKKRPSMEFIFEMMSKLNTVVNRNEPIKPIVNLHAAGSSETNLSQSASSTSLRKHRTTHGSISSNDMTQETVKNENNMTSSTERLNKTSDFLIIRPEEPQGFHRHQPQRLSFNNQPYESISENEVPPSFNNLTNNPVRRPAPLPPSKPNHRRSRSYGEPSFLSSASASLNYQESYLMRLNNRVESFTHNPLPPVKNHQDSLNIYKKHCDLIKYDNALDDRVKYLSDELKRLRQKEQTLSEFCDLVKKKELLIAENARLKNKLVQELHLQV